MQENKSIPKNLTYEKVYNFALEFFGYDRDKTNIWWMTKSDEFDGRSPFQMVKDGMGRKLIRFLEKCI